MSRLPVPPVSPKIPASNDTDELVERLKWAGENLECEGSGFGAACFEAIAALTSLRAERDAAIDDVEHQALAAEQSRRNSIENWKSFKVERERAEAAESSLAAEKLRVAELTQEIFHLEGLLVDAQRIPAEPERDGAVKAIVKAAMGPISDILCDPGEELQDFIECDLERMEWKGKAEALEQRVAALVGALNDVALYCSKADPRDELVMAILGVIRDGTLATEA